MFPHTFLSWGDVLRRKVDIAQFDVLGRSTIA